MYSYWKYGKSNWSRLFWKYTSFAVEIYWYCVSEYERERVIAVKSSFDGTLRPSWHFYRFNFDFNFVLHWAIDTNLPSFQQKLLAVPSQLGTWTWIVNTTSQFSHIFHFYFTLPLKVVFCDTALIMCLLHLGWYGIIWHCNETTDEDLSFLNLW